MQDIINFYPITERVGTSGQPSRDQIASIAEAGYRVVINLAMPDSDNAIADEGSLVSSLGMAYVHLPVPFDAPDSGHLRRFVGIMQALENDQVFVHCAVNARVSAFMFKYLTLCKGADPDAATSPVLRQWLPRMDPVWCRFMELGPEVLND